MRLEPSMWEALASISGREGRTIHEMATEIDRRRGKTAMTSAVRVFVLAYYQRLASDLEERLENGVPMPGADQRRVRTSSGAGEVLDDVFGPE
jgi:predicted DNA-binding ribbon-helix-helix protein